MREINNSDNNLQYCNVLGVLGVLGELQYCTVNYQKSIDKGKLLYQVWFNAVGFELMRARVLEVLRLARHFGTTDEYRTACCDNELLHSCPKSTVLRVEIFRLRV